MEKYQFQIRVTGVLIQGNRVLLVKQRISDQRGWSLPGGRAEAGERLDEAVIREVREETGLTVEVERLLYLCDKTDARPPIVHITFLLRETGGEITLPTNELDANPIGDVLMVPFDELVGLGFGQRFVELLSHGFPGAGSYMGEKRNIGL